MDENASRWIFIDKEKAPDWKYYYDKVIERLGKDGAKYHCGELSGTSNVAVFCDTEDGFDEFSNMWKEVVQEPVEKPIEDDDPVNHPSYYTQGGIECIDAMKASMKPEEFRGYLRGCAFKYLWRFEDKGNAIQDLEKAHWYLDKLEDEIDGE